ncbi:MAG: hypothetical protein ACPL5F_14725 [Moorellaceae bacterium]
MKLTQIAKRLEKLEAATEKEKPRREVFMVADRPVTLGLLEEEPPVPPGHLRLYFVNYGDGGERYKDVPKGEVCQWLQGSGLVVWIVDDENFLPGNT